MDKNRYEVQGRVRKTQAILGAARVLHLTATQVATDLDGARARLVEVANVIEPSNETWRQVLAAMLRDEATLAGYAAAVADRRPMPRTARTGQFAEWAGRGIVHDRVGAPA